MHSPPRFDTIQVVNKIFLFETIYLFSLYFVDANAPHAYNINLGTYYRSNTLMSPLYIRIFIILDGNFDLNNGTNEK